MEEINYLDKGIAIAWEYGPKLITALAILIIGLWLIKKITHIFAATLDRQKVDASLRPFFTSVVNTGMKVALLLIVAGRMGFETTSFIAILSALAFAIGLALQGSLGNFASGVLILLFRPYKVGDVVTITDKVGKVEEIQIFNTILSTPQNKRIIIPNAKITEGPIENMSNTQEIRSDINLDVEDHTSINLVRATVEEVARQCPYTLKEKAPFVGISGYPRNAATVTVGFWVLGEDYFDTQYYMYEEIKKAFDTVGIVLSKEDGKND